MRPRHDITVIFSTFVQWSEERFNGWLADPKLRRSMEKSLAQSSEGKNSVNFWALYWHKNWQVQTDSLAEAHLSAYLQESAFWAARKISTSFASQQYKLSDCFQIAFFALGRILKGFNPDLSTKLKDYAQVSFRAFIRDTLRQRWETDLCSNWSLLRKLSQKRLAEALANVGLSDREIARYQLAWRCFKDLYAPTRSQGMRQLAKPTAATWEAIARAYNAERRSQLTQPGEECSPATLEQWLKSSAKAVRAYLYPPVASLNVLKPGQGSGEFLDDLPDRGSESLLAGAIASEETQQRQHQQEQLNAVLVGAIAKLTPQIQEMLQLYYGKSTTQQQIAQQLEVKQYTVSRRMTKARESLLAALVQWSQETLKVSLDSDFSSQMGAVLEEWLQGYYE